MGTKGTRSSGTQITPKGANQGNVLVDPRTGQPVDVVTDVDGVRRIAVDANITAQIPQIQVELDYNEDSVQIGDPNTQTTLKINPDGSIDSNVEIDAGDGDNVGLKVQDRTVTPSDGQYNKRVTAKTGSVNTDTTSMDVSLHDHQGNEFTTLNPMPVTASYEKFFAPIAASKWMELGNYDEVIPSILGANLTLSYKEDGVLLGEALITNYALPNWSIKLTRYMAEDDGSLLLDDDDTPLFLE